MSDTNAPNTTTTPSRRLATWHIIAAVVGVVLVAAVMFGAGLLPRGDRIALGVQAMDQDLGGLTRDEARARLREAAKRVDDARITLQVGPHTEDDRLADIGVTADPEPAVDEAYGIGRRGSIVTRLNEAWKARQGGRALKSSVKFEEETARKRLQALAKELDKPARDATARWDAGAKRLVVTPERVGAKVDIIGSLKTIAYDVAEALNNGRPAPQVLELPYLANRPRVLAEMFSGVDTELGGFATSYATSTRNRASNVETAAQAINGTILMPGEEFSFNKVVGPRTAASGFREAPVIQDGQLQPGMGGGVCQVSTTLYNAVLLANLEITRRSHHSLPIHYAPPGRDATVSYPALDFRFRNNTSGPVVIHMPAGSRRIAADIIGRGPKPDVRIELSGLGTIPGKTVRRNDPTLPKGVEKVEQRGGSGKTVTVHRIANGKREFISRDRYNGELRIIRVGTGPAPQPAAPAAAAPAPPTSSPRG